MSKKQPSIIKWEVKNVHMRALDDQNDRNVSDVLKKWSWQEMWPRSHVWDKGLFTYSLSVCDGCSLAPDGNLEYMVRDPRLAASLAKR
jgi:hypothetical protein